MGPAQAVARSHPTSDRHSSVGLALPAGKASRLTHQAAPAYILGDMVSSAMSIERIALVSDIHGNEIALRAVLADIRQLGVDRIACLGDVAALGPKPSSVLDLVNEHCEVFILGNHDEYMFAPDLIGEHTTEPTVVGSVDACRSELSSAELSFIEGFERKHELSLGAAGSLLLFHGSPSSNNVDLLAGTPDAELSEQLGADRATVMAGGHTHIQMLRQHGGTLLVNPGSVGLAFERFVDGSAPTLMPWAEYAIVEAAGPNVAVSLRRVALDLKALLVAARAWDAPLARYQVAQYERLLRASGHSS